MPVIFGQDNPQCQVPEVQAAVARFTLYGNFIAGLLSAFTSPKLGAFSDRHGRPRVMAFIVAGSFLGEILNIIAANYPDMFNVNLLLLGYAMEGICGSFVAAMALTNAYASDTTSPAKRAVAFAYIHGILFGGIALGPPVSRLYHQNHRHGTLNLLPCLRMPHAVLPLPPLYRPRIPHQRTSTPRPLKTRIHRLLSHYITRLVNHPTPLAHKFLLLPKRKLLLRPPLHPRPPLRPLAHRSPHQPLPPPQPRPLGGSRHLHVWGRHGRHDRHHHLQRIHVRLGKF